MLHDFRNMYRTLEKNNSPEYRQLFTELHSIIHDAIKLWEEHQKTSIPKSPIHKLQKRIDALVHTLYMDLDPYICVHKFLRN